MIIYSLQVVRMDPIRCFSCGTIVSSKIEQFRCKEKTGLTCDKMLCDIGVRRYCCRMIILATVDVDMEP